MSSSTEPAFYPERLSASDALLELPSDAARAAFAALRAHGPGRFSQVSSTLYRGGQPGPEDLAQLRQLGVSTVISLRREERKVRRYEAREVERLGMKFLSFPYYGVFGASRRFFERILHALRDPESGVVYLHCQHGRDRTSLAVALHLVIDEGWDAETAWKRAVLEYGHRPNFWYSELRANFDKMVRRLRMKLESERVGPDSAR